MSSRFVMDEPDKEGFREIREVYPNGEEGIIGWINFVNATDGTTQIDNHDEQQFFENIILDSLNRMTDLWRLLGRLHE